MKKTSNKVPQKRIALHNQFVRIKSTTHGITLVALVITIIVLLILAGITMSTLLGDNGIIKKAQEAGDKYKNAAINEQEQLNAIGDLLEQTGIPTGEIVFTPDVTNPRNTTKTGEQNGIATGPIKVNIDYKKEKGLVREYIVVKQGQTIAEATWQTVTTNPVIIDVTQNVTILARYKNIAQVPSDTTVCNIVCVDNIVPDVYSYEVTNTTTNSITVKAETQDTANEGAGPNIAGIAKYQYSKDNGVTWEEDEINPSNTSYTFTNLTQNQGYKIAVKAMDKAGNERLATNNGTTVTTSEIAGGNEDNTGLINIVLSNNNWTNQNITVTVNWPSNIEGLTKLISTDGGANFHTYTAAETISQNTTIMARLKDSTGQVSSKTAVLNITNIDKLKPNAFTFTTSTTTNSITVTGSATDQAQTATNGASGIKGYQYSINNGAWTEITTNTTNTFGNLTQGQSYTIKMKAIDNVGNEIEASNTGASVTVGTIPGGDGGLINIVLSNSNWTNQNITVTVNWPSNIEGLTKLISTDGGTNFHTYTAAETITQNTTIMARLKDSTGQVSSKTASLAISNIDKVGPTITAVDTNTKTIDSITVKVTGANDQGIGTIAGYQYYLSSWGGTEGGTKTFTGLADNTTYNIYIKAVDSLGNIGTQVGPYSVTTNLGELTKPYLPDGTYSYLSGTDLNNGLVCTNGTSQYVWVEVPRSVTVSATTTAQIESALQNYASVYRGSGYTDTWYDGCGITDATAYNNLKNKMLNSIKTYGGFWIGRYEAGTADNSIRTSNVVTTANAVSAQDRYPYNYITCSQAQELSNRNSTSNYSSSLMFGIQWDLTCKYLESKEIAQATINSDSTSIGNYYNATFAITRGKYSTDWGSTYTNVSGSYTKPASSILLTTGASERNKTMNIYDLAGNEWEWTLEKSITSGFPCAYRGGVYNSGGYGGPLAYRYYSNTSYSGLNFSFRQTLYK